MTVRWASSVHLDCNPFVRVPTRTDGLFGLYRMWPDGSHRQAILPLSSFRPSLIDWGSRQNDG
ncbi:MAG TPA: hypothetical protein VH813_05730 [Candidatus Limnocylindrales bacterium]